MYLTLHRIVLCVCTVDRKYLHYGIYVRELPSKLALARSEGWNGRERRKDEASGKVAPACPGSHPHCHISTKCPPHFSFFFLSWFVF